jgi:hypothetical protein
MKLKLDRKNLWWWFWPAILALISLIQISCIPGPQGPPGPAGPQGPPGNLGLAGKVCPQGTFLKGFDANGDIVCAPSGPAVISTVDSVGISMPKTAIAIGSDGLPVISYPVTDMNWRVEHLKVVHCGNAACSDNNTISMVDDSDGVGGYASIAIGSDGLPVISYWDRENIDLKVAHCGDVACTSGNTLTTVDSSGNVGYDTALAIGSDGLPVISYFDSTNHALKVVHCGNESCSASNTISVVDGDALGMSVGETSIAIGSDGLPVISYYDSSEHNLKVAHCGNLDCSANNSIATVYSTGDVGYYNAIAIGSDSWPVISAYDDTNGNLLVIHCRSATCNPASNSIATVDWGLYIGGQSGKAGLHNEITIGHDGLPLISYYDHSYSHLRVLHCGDIYCSAGASARTTVDFSDGSGFKPDIVVGNDGHPVISYLDLNKRTLKVAQCARADCSP